MSAPSERALTSRRIRDIDMVMLETEALCKVRAERLDAVTLGGVMARCNESDSAFAREMHRLLRDFAREKNVDAESHRFVEIALRGAGAPRHAPNRARRIADDERN